MQRRQISAVLLAGVLLLGVSGCQSAPERPVPRGASPSTSEAPVPPKERAPEPEAEPEPEPAPEPQAATEFTAEGMNGRWCPTPESRDSYGCLTIEFPTATYDSGSVQELTELDVQHGGLLFSVPGAPFGIFYVAGTAIDIADFYFPITDVPDQDRIWNSQTGTMLLRSE